MNNSVLYDLKEHLHSYDYWSSTALEGWDITTHDLALCKASPITKQAAHAHLFSDLALLSTAQSSEVQKQARIVQTQLKNCKSNKVNVEFWSKTAIELNKSHFEKAAVDASLENAVKETAVSVLHEINNGKRKASIEPTPSVATKKQAAKKQKGVEYDNVQFEGMNESVGTVIKNHAIELHDKFVKNKGALSSSERKIMSNGLSSMLDLVDVSSLGQRSLFEARHWDSIMTYFKEKLIVEAPAIDGNIINNLKVIVDIIKKSQNLNMGSEYLFKAYPRYMKSPVYNELRLIEHSLEIMINHSELLTKSSPQSVTEADYLCLIWSRYFDLLFPKSSHVRVKRGESTSENSTMNKKELYMGADNVIGFKIDVRFVVDHNNTEYDVATGEVAKHDQNKKVIDDEGKLCREAKDIADFLLCTLPFEQSHSCIGWAIQIAGSSCITSSVHLAENGLYVNMPRGHCVLPPTIDKLDKIEESVLPVLLAFRSGVNAVADLLMKELQAKPADVNGPLGRKPQQERVNYTAYHQRDTWYTPPGNHRSKVPTNLFGFAPPRPIIEKLLKLSYEKRSGISDNGLDLENDDSSYDQFGFKEVENGFYNKTTDTIWDHHPHA